MSPPDSSVNGGGPSSRLAEIAVPIGSKAPGAARQIVAHCLSRLVTPRILDETQLLVSELLATGWGVSRGRSKTVCFDMARA